MARVRAGMVAAGLVWLALLAGCSSRIGPPEVQGRAAMVNDAGTPRLWVLTKREEERRVSISSTRTSSSSRIAVFYHFDLLALDPETARPLWTRRLLTLGDPDSYHYGPTRIVGSASGAKFIGQEGRRVWLFADEYLIALDAADGEVLATLETVEQANPALAGLLPRDEKHYGFDQGLVFMAADARQFVLRGDALKAEAYSPPAASTPADGAGALADRRGPCNPARAPLVMGFGEVPARFARTESGLLGLYTDKERDDAINDQWGDHLCWPDSILKEGDLARRSLWRLTAEEQTDAYGETFERLTRAEAVDGAPVFLRGRFLKAPGTGEPRAMAAPAGFAVWHVTRIDAEGRLALTRLGADLSVAWTSELPLSDNSLITPVQVWPLGEGRLAIMGDEMKSAEGVRTISPRLVSLDLADGSWQGWDVATEAAIPR